MMSDIIFFTLALIAEIIGTIWWFGSSILFVPLAWFFLPFHQVLWVTALFHVFSNIAKLAFFYKSIRRNLLLLIGVPSVIFVVLGAYMSKFIDGDIANLLLGVFCIAFSIFFFIIPQYTIKPSKRNMIVSGSLAGRLAGLIGTGGVVRGIGLTALNLQKSIYIATSAGIDFGVDASRSVVYYLQGYMSEVRLWYVIGLIAVAFIGSYIGKQIINRISQERFRQLVLAFIFLTGIIMIYKYFQVV